MLPVFSLGVELGEGQSAAVVEAPPSQALDQVLPVLWPGGLHRVGSGRSVTR